MAVISFEISGKKYKRNLPDSFAELTRSQTLRLAELFMVLKIPMTGLSDEERFTLLRHLLAIPEDHFYAIGEIGILSLLQSSPFRDPDKVLTGEPVLKYIHLPGHFGFWRKGYLPAKGLKHSNFLRFILAEEFYQNLQQEKDFEDNLNGLCSVLCIPRGSVVDTDVCNIVQQKLAAIQGKHRQRFIIERFAVLQYYHGTRQQLISDFGPMFSGSGGFREGPDFTSKYRWWALAHDLAEKHVFGDFEETVDTNLYNVLHHVCYNADKYKESEMRKIIYG